MEESNEQILLSKGYTFVKENKETGWTQIQIEESDGKFTAFWIPNQLVGHLMNLYYLEENVGLLQTMANKNRAELADLRKLVNKAKAQKEEAAKKIDAQRKSITYYKGERDALQRFHNKISTDFSSRQKAYIEKLERFSRVLDSIEEESVRKSEEIDFLTHKNKILTTVSVFLASIFTAFLVFWAAL